MEQITVIVRFDIIICIWFIILSLIITCALSQLNVINKCFIIFHYLSLNGFIMKLILCLSQVTTFARFEIICLFVVLVDDVAVANGFLPCALVKLLNWGHGVKGRCFSFDVTLTSWEEEEMEAEEASSWISGKTPHTWHTNTHICICGRTFELFTHRVGRALNVSK